MDTLASVDFAEGLINHTLDEQELLEIAYPHSCSMQPPANPCGIYQAWQTATSHGLVTQHSIFAHPPTKYDWESIWPVFTRLYLYEGQSLPVIMKGLRETFGFRATSNMFKKRIMATGLDKHLKHQDIVTMAWVYARYPHYTMSFFVRGRPVSIAEILRYLKRRRLNLGDATDLIDSGEQQPSSNVSIFFPASIQSTSCAFNGKFGDLMDGMRKILHGAMSTGACPSLENDALSFHIDPESRKVASDLKSTVWAGITFHLDEEYNEAGLCWQSAYSQLENLCPSPDLDLWTIYVSCCLSLQQHGVLVVVRSLINKMRCLYDVLADSSLHKPFLKALLAISAEDMTEAALFFLKARTLLIQSLWPQQKKIHFLTKMDLAEARILAHYQESQSEIPLAQEIGAPAELIDNVSPTFIQIQASRISSCVLLRDYAGAENIAATCVARLRLPFSGEGADIQRAFFHVVLANVQYIQRKDLEAKLNYEAALQIHCAYKIYTSDDGLLTFGGRIQILRVLDWLSNANKWHATTDETQWAKLRRSLQSQWTIHIQKTIRKPFKEHIFRKNLARARLEPCMSCGMALKIICAERILGPRQRPVITSYRHQKLETSEEQDSHTSAGGVQVGTTSSKTEADLKTGHFGDGCGSGSFHFRCKRCRPSLYTPSLALFPQLQDTTIPSKLY